MDEISEPKEPCEKTDKEPETEYPMGFKENCFSIRETIKAVKVSTISLKSHRAFDEGEPIGSDRFSEMKANIMLAYRHLEDARMRLGKTIQAYDGGESCYPK